MGEKGLKCTHAPISRTKLKSFEPGFSDSNEADST